jgi:hypothetical protein
MHVRAESSPRLSHGDPALEIGLNWAARFRRRRELIVEKRHRRVRFSLHDRVRVVKIIDHSIKDRVSDTPVLNRRDTPT